MAIRLRMFACLVCFLASGAVIAPAADWPAWRYDAARSAASPDELPQRLELLWTRKFSPRTPAWDAPLNRDKMTYDRLAEPIVAGGRIFLAPGDSDKLLALDADSGRELWRFYAEGPIRLAPAVWKDKIYFTSDDGHLYCVAAETGKLLWRFRGIPSAQKVLGNRRVISMWPARGGPVLRDGRVFFAAGIWPFMGVFLYALDAADGSLAWVNDHTGPYYSLQPHGSAAFGGVAPQGALVATDKLLLVPGGRSLPAAFDRKTGTMRYFHNSGIVGGKGIGGSFVAADEHRFFVHSRRRGVRAFDLEKCKQQKLALAGEPVLHKGVIYSAGGRDASNPVAIVEAIGPAPWKLKVDGRGDLIKAGGRLYAAGKNTIAAIDLPKADRPAKVAWTLPVKHSAERLLAADGKLFAVTPDGHIMAFGRRKQNTPKATQQQSQPLADLPKPTRHVDALLKHTGATAGYAVCFGAEDPAIQDALLLRSKIHLIVVDPDRAKIERLRRRYDNAGMYGKRIAAHVGDPRSFKAPSYIAHLVLVGAAVAEKADDAAWREMYRSVRPYGGTMWIAAGKDKLDGLSQRIAKLELSGAKISRHDNALSVVRAGPLSGAADWNHLYGNIGNTGKSADTRVKLPLGILWFGGNSNESTRLTPVAPPEQVVGGRLFIHGMRGFTARDVYTGREMWHVGFRPGDLARFGVKADAPRTEPPPQAPKDPYAVHKFNRYQGNTRGTSFVATKKFIYVVREDQRACQVLDVRNGKTLKVFQLPPLPGEKQPAWSYIGVYKDILLAGWGHADFSARMGGKSAPDKSTCAGLLALDRNTGRVLWKTTATHALLNNAIVAGGGRVYFLDRPPQAVKNQYRRRGKKPSGSYRLMALDAATGKTLWQVDRDVFGIWLGYSEQHDVLLQAIDHGPARIVRRTPGRGMAAHAGRDGSQLWHKKTLDYFGPCLILGDKVLTNGKFYGTSVGAFYLKDGSPVMIDNPLTGQKQPWRISRGYGCNSMRAGEHLLTYRSGSAACYDLRTKAGTTSLGGFRSGCSSNLIIAGGVLNAPDFTRHCTCNFQNQSSLALIHMPDVKMEQWTCQYGPLNPNDFLAWRSIRLAGPLKRVGINLGAPGDRQADDGTLWVDYPDIGGASYHVPVEIDGRPGALRRHEAFIKGPLPWVSASCLVGVRKLSIDLGKQADKRSPRRARVTLYFAELGYKQPGQRVFDVLIEGKKVLTKFDVAREAGGINRSLVKRFDGVTIDGKLDIELTPLSKDHAAMLSGIEVLVETPR